jgi:hypothetical protein
MPAEGGVPGMRAAWLPLALLLVAGVVSAQVPTPAFEVAASPGSSTVAPGNSTLVTITATRHCPSQAVILDEQTAALAVQHSPQVSVAAPGQVVFQQQTCATDPQQTIEVQVTVSIPSDYNGSGLAELRAMLQPRSAAAPVGGPGEEASVTFVVNVGRPAMTAVASAQAEPALDAPALPAVLLAAALLAAAFALRRR